MRSLYCAPIFKHVSAFHLLKFKMAPNVSFWIGTENPPSPISFFFFFPSFSLCNFYLLPVETESKHKNKLINISSLLDFKIDFFFFLNFNKKSFELSHLFSTRSIYLLLSLLKPFVPCLFVLLCSLTNQG